MLVVLYKNGKRKNHFVHVLVAKAFVPNPFDKPQVNHINGDKIDNRVENLKWVTVSENTALAKKFGVNGENILNVIHYRKYTDVE